MWGTCRVQKTTWYILYVHQIIFLALDDKNTKSFSLHLQKYNWFGFLVPHMSVVQSQNCFFKIQWICDRRHWMHITPQTYRDLHSAHPCAKIKWLDACSSTELSEMESSFSQSDLIHTSTIPFLSLCNMIILPCSELTGHHTVLLLDVFCPNCWIWIWDEAMSSAGSQNIWHVAFKIFTSFNLLKPFFL